MKLAARISVGSLIVAMIALAVAACGSSGAGVATTESTTATTLGEEVDVTAVDSTETTEAKSDDSNPLALPWGATVDLGDLQITVSEPIDDTANLDEIKRDMMLEPGEKAIYCMVTIANSGDESFSYNSLGFTMYDAEGLSYDSLFPVSSQAELGSGDLLPGKTVKGAISYAMPEGSAPDYVAFQRTIIDKTEAAWGE